MYGSLLSVLGFVAGALAYPRGGSHAVRQTGSVQFVGVNIAGFDFGCAINVSGCFGLGEWHTKPALLTVHARETVMSRPSMLPCRPWVDPMGKHSLDFLEKIASTC